MRLGVSVGCMLLEAVGDEIPGLGYVCSQVMERGVNNVLITSVEHGHRGAALFEDNIAGFTIKV